VILCDYTDVVVVVVVVCRGNGIGADGGAAIATALATNTTLMTDIAGPVVSCVMWCGAM